jgi:hypothetical protein
MKTAEKEKEEKKEKRRACGEIGITFRLQRKGRGIEALQVHNDGTIV